VGRETPTTPTEAHAGVVPDLGSYGPTAFGVVALLAIWRAIVKPQLDAARQDRLKESERSREALTNAAARLEGKIVEGNELIRNVHAAVLDIPDRIRDRDNGEGSVRLVQ
jgi:hypothetical protein